MHAEALTVPIRPRDRLATTLCFALLVHGLLILGIGFTADDPTATGQRTLEIVLVNAPDDERPDRADYLADAAQRGAGNTDERTRPRSPDATRGDPSADAVRGSGTARAAGREPDASADDARPPASDASDPVIAATGAHVQVALTLRAGAGSAAPAAFGTPVMLPSIPADTRAHTAVAYSGDPRERFISVNTDEALYATYLHAWRERVERVGNLNYPDEARRRGLDGALELEVALGAAGNVRQLRVRRSSGHRLLDDAALRIVYMAAPFPPFPDELKREVDALRFVFVWEFGDGVAASSVRAPR